MAMVPVGGAGVGSGAVVVGEGVPGTGTEGSTSVVTGSAGGTGITMLTGRGDESVGMIVSIVVGDGVALVGVPCTGAGVAGLAAVVPVAAVVAPVILCPVPLPSPDMEPTVGISDWLGTVSVVGGTCVDDEEMLIVRFSAPEDIVPFGRVHPAQARNMNSITMLGRSFIKERPGI